MPQADLRVPAEWEAVRAAVAEAIGPAWIVGGAMRDLDNDRPVKDLDIFVSVDHPAGAALTPDGINQYEARLRAKVPGLEIVGHMDPSYIAAMRDEVLYIFTCRVPDVPLDVQVILSSLLNVSAAVDRVDFALCQIAWTGTATHRTDSYLQDCAAQTFTLVQAKSKSDHDRSMRRFDRLTSEKYPGWTLVDQADPFMELQ